MKIKYLSTLFKHIIGWPLMLLAFFFIGKILVTQIPLLMTKLHAIQPYILVLGIISFIIFYFLRSYIWYRIVINLGLKITFHSANYYWAMSELKRYIPGGIWSFLGRSVLFKQQGMKQKDIAKGVIIEAEVFILGCLIISLLAIPIILPHLFQIGILILVFLVFFVSIGYCSFSRLSHYLPKHIRRVINFLIPHFSFQEHLSLLCMSSVALFFFGLGNYFVISSVIPLNLQLIFQLIGVFVFAFVAGYLSVITPAGFGVREGILIILLTNSITAILASFAALFSRLLLIIAELLYILLGFIWKKTHNTFLKEIETHVAQYPQVILVAIMSFIYALYFTTASFLRYDNYYTGRFDLGNMAQTVWNTMHGRIFLFTNPDSTEQISRLAFHADFILILLAPFYSLWQNPKMLLLIQTLVVAAGAFFVYMIARDVLKNRNLGLVFSFIYLLNPSVQRANLYDFHAVTLVTTLLFATYYFFLKKQYKLFILFSLLAAICKEQIWLIIALFGLVTFFINKKRLLGSALFFSSLALFFFIFWYAIPHARSSQHFALAYLSDFGDNPTNIVKNLITSPNKIVSTLLHPSQLHYLFQLFSPLGYLSLAFPFFLFFAGPDLLISLLSNNEQLRQIYYQYTTSVTPFLFLSAIYGVWALKQLTIVRTIKKHFILIISIYLISTTFYSASIFGPLPGSQEPNIDMFTKPQQNKAFIDHYLQSIPAKATVSSSNDIGSHLSERETIYTVPFGLDRADLVVLLLTDPKAIDAYKRMEKDPKYKQIQHKDTFYVYQKIK
jgi:uncharacterized membrane protein/uncharacterized membrane protein YbhN (UPF0104 family)